MILEISITAKKEDTKAISYALQLIENGNTKRKEYYKDGQKDGRWTYHNKDGVVISTKDYDASKDADFMPPDL